MATQNMVKDGHLGGYIHGGDPGTWCPRLWTWAKEEFAINSVMDVGCGEGHSANFFRSLGCHITGVEGCSQAIKDSAIPDRVMQHDFCQSAFRPAQAHDLVWSCEFLEHVEQKYVPNILQTFAHAAKVIMLTHAFPGQDDGHHHVNCQPSSYWIRLIEALGFVCDKEKTIKARIVTLQDYHRTNHFARSGLVFVRDSNSKVAIGEMPEATKLNWLEDTTKTWHAAMRALQIQTAFRFSKEYGEHQKRRRALKRQKAKSNPKAA